MNFLSFDRLMSGEFKNLIWWTAKYTIAIFLLLWLIALLLSWLGVLSGRWNFIHAFVDLTNPYIGDDSHDLYSYFDQALVIVINLFGMFVLNGVLLTVLVNWISNRRERFVMGEARYNVLNNSENFVVIIGGHPMTPRLTRQLYDKHQYDFILIQSRRPVPQLRKELAALMSPQEMEHVVIYAGERTSPLDLSELNLPSAKAIYILGETFVYDGTSHDALSMKCWELISATDIHHSAADVAGEAKDDNTDREARLKATPAKVIPVHVMFEYQASFNAFQSTDLNLQEVKMYRFVPFSIYETWAQQVLVPLPGCETTAGTGRRQAYIPLDGPRGLPYESGQRVHLIIAGMSKMGMALAIEAAHVAHYSNNLNKEAGCPRTLITFIDRNAAREMHYFMGRFKNLFQLARWRYIKAPDAPSASYSGPSLYDSQADMETSHGQYPWVDPLTSPEAGSPYYGIYEPDGESYLGEDMMDIDWEFIEGDIALPSIQQYIRDAAADNSPNYLRTHTGIDRSSRTTLAICLPVSSEATSAALCLYDSVYDDAQEILVHQNETGSLIDLISSGKTGTNKSKYANMRAFGMADECEYLPRIDRIMPRLVAYAYELVYPGSNLSEKFKAIGPELFRNVLENNWRMIATGEIGKSAIAKMWSNVYCANAMLTAVRSHALKPTLAMMPYESCEERRLVEALAAAEHNRWVTEQLLLGFAPIPYSPEFRYPRPMKELSDKEKNALKARNRQLKTLKIHPDLVSNRRLLDTQIYDIEIVRSIPTILYINDFYHSRSTDV